MGLFLGMEAFLKGLCDQCRGYFYVIFWITARLIEIVPGRYKFELVSIRITKEFLLFTSGSL